VLAPATTYDYSSREPEVLAAIPERLAPLEPKAILLFGSRARGDAKPDSDYDLCVILDPPAGGTGDPSSAQVRRLLFGLGVPFDIVVYTPERWAAGKHHPLGLSYRILREAKVLYGSP
jgi:predicted nucleotidyltransferase